MLRANRDASAPVYISCLQERRKLANQYYYVWFLAPTLCSVVFVLLFFLAVFF